MYGAPCAVGMVPTASAELRSVNGEEEMNRHERRATRVRARNQGPIPMTAEEVRNGPRDRAHIVNLNMREIRTYASAMPDGNVLVVADSRDLIARKWVAAIGGFTEAELRRREAPFILGRTIPTFFLSVDRAVAMDLTATHAPSASEGIETKFAHRRVVLIIASKGTSLLILPEAAS